ncbi:hypothetical protein M073_0284, partial [Bacteroides fragilis str. DS-71]
KVKQRKRFDSMILFICISFQKVFKMPFLITSSSFLSVQPEG